MISHETLEALKEDVIIAPLKLDIAQEVISLCPKFHKKGYQVYKMPDRLYHEIYRKTVRAYYLCGNHTIEQVQYDAISNSGRVPPEVCFLDNDFFTQVHHDPEFIAMHSDFAGVELSPSYFYGPRVYHKNDILREHIDHPTTHLIGSSLNVFCEGDKNWPLVFKIGDIYEEVILEPGQMAIFEAVRIPHSRPVKFKGDRYFGLFFHFSPKNVKEVLSEDYLKRANEYEKVM